jgi:hypothetical protein
MELLRKGNRQMEEDSLSVIWKFLSSKFICDKPAFLQAMSAQH